MRRTGTAALVITILEEEESRVAINTSLHLPAGGRQRPAPHKPQDSWAKHGCRPRPAPAEGPGAPRAPVGQDEVLPRGRMRSSTVLLCAREEPGALSRKRYSSGKMSPRKLRKGEILR